jgi:hypothetical protein
VSTVRAVKALLGGFAAFLGLAVVGELGLQAMGWLVHVWSEAAGPLVGWRLLVTNAGLFVARYFIFMLPPLLLLCLASSLVLVWSRSRNAAA